MTAMKEQPSARQIYGTIGPACADVKTLEAMFRAGMTGIRLNLSHVTLAQAADQVDALHKAAQRCGKQAELLMEDGIEVVNGRVDLKKYGMKF